MAIFRKGGVYIHIYTHAFLFLMPCEKTVGVFVKDAFENRTEVSLFKKIFFFHFPL